MIDIATTLERMKSACPVECKCYISGDKKLLTFTWLWAIKKVSYTYGFSLSTREIAYSKFDIILHSMVEAGNIIDLKIKGIT